MVSWSGATLGIRSARGNRSDRKGPLGLVVFPSDGATRNKIKCGCGEGHSLRMPSWKLMHNRDRRRRNLVPRSRDSIRGRWRLNCLWSHTWPPYTRHKEREWLQNRCKWCTTSPAMSTQCIGQELRSAHPRIIESMLRRWHERRLQCTLTVIVPALINRSPNDRFGLIGQNLLVLHLVRGNYKRVSGVSC